MLFLLAVLVMLGEALASDRSAGVGWGVRS